MRFSKPLLVTLSICSLVTTEAKEMPKMPNIQDMVKNMGGDGKGIQDMLKNMGGDGKGIQDMLKNMGGNGKGIQDMLKNMGGDGKMPGLDKIMEKMGGNGKMAGFGNMFNNLGKKADCSHLEFPTCPNGQVQVQNITQLDNIKVHGCKLEHMIPDIPGFEGIAKAEEHHEKLDMCCVEQHVCHATCQMSTDACHQKWDVCVKNVCNEDASCKMEAGVFHQLAHQTDDHQHDHEKSLAENMELTHCASYSNKQTAACECVDEAQVELVMEEMCDRFSCDKDEAFYAAVKDATKRPSWVHDVMLNNFKSQEGSIIAREPSALHQRQKKMFNNLDLGKFKDTFANGGLKDMFKGILGDGDHSNHLNELLDQLGEL